MKQRLLPVLVGLIGLPVGALGLERYASVHAADPLVITVTAQAAAIGTDDADEGVTGPVSDAHQRARDLARRGDVHDAFALFDAEVRAHPDDARLLGGYGYWLLAAGRAEDAAPLLVRAHGLAPDSDAVTLNLAVAWRRLGRLDDAERLLVDLVDRRPTYRLARYALAGVLRRQGRMDEAITLLEDTAENGGNDERAQTLVALGRLYVTVGRPEDAATAFDRAVEWAPAQAEVRLGAALAYLADGPERDLDRARRFLEEAAALAPDAANVCHARGRLAEATGDLQQAEEHYRRAVSLDPLASRSKRRLVHLALDRGDLDTARFQADRLVETDPTDADAHFLAGLVWAKQGDATKAAEAYQRSLTLTEGTYAEAWFNLAIASRVLGDDDAAEAAYRGALAQRPGYVAAMNNLGLLLSNAGRQDEARALYTQATTTDPTYAPAWFHLGQLLLDTDPDGAVVAFSGALKARPRDAKTGLNLGLALSRAGRDEDAAARYRTLISEHPRYVRAHYNLSVVLGRLGRSSDELAAVREAVRVDPSHLPSLRKLARLEAEGGDVATARALYREALDRDPSDDRSRAALEALRDGPAAPAAPPAP